MTLTGTCTGLQVALLHENVTFPEYAPTPSDVASTVTLALPGAEALDGAVSQFPLLLFVLVAIPISA